MTRSYWGNYFHYYTEQAQQNYHKKVHNISEEDRPLGGKIFGKARIECTLLESRNKWGLLGHTLHQGRRVPEMGGLMFFELRFYQPRHCRMSSVTVQVEFVTPDTPGSEPYIMDLAPKLMFGKAKQYHISRVMELRPEIKAAGFSEAIGGISRTTESTDMYRWNFSGHRQPNAQQKLARLVWKWEAREKGAELFERPIIAAVVIKHTAQPFNVQVHVSGEPEAVTSKFRILKSKHAIKSADVVPGKITKDFEREIQRLNSVIEEENMKQAGMEYIDFLPGRRPAPDGTQTDGEQMPTALSFVNNLRDRMLRLLFQLMAIVVQAFDNRFQMVANYTGIQDRGRQS